jgi:LysM repeat protein
MKNPIPKLRRFFVRSRTYHATASRAASQAPVADDDGSDGNRLSGAFIIVLILHVIAVMGVFAFARMKDSAGKDAAPKANTAQTTVPKPTVPKPAIPAAAASLTTVSAPLLTHDAQRLPVGPVQKTHTVKDGETLTKIAALTGVGVADIVSANKLKSGDDIHTGQVLMIPSVKVAQKTSTPAPTPATDSKTAKTYTVKKGDSPMKIAREHNCTYEELMKLNGIKDPKKIQPGQTLKLPAKNG